MRGDDTHPALPDHGSVDSVAAASNGAQDKDNAGQSGAVGEEASGPAEALDASITDELAALYDDGRNYAQAEVTFQKTRAKIAGRQLAIAIACGVVAVILLHIAFLALAVGLVMALAPLVTIWGAIAIVFGGIILLVALLGLKAKSSGTRLAALFTSETKGGSN